EVRKPNKLLREAKGVLAEQRRFERLQARPHEKYEADRELRSEQRDGKENAREDDALFLHARDRCQTTDLMSSDPSSVLRPPPSIPYMLAFSNWRSRSLPRRAALSSASLALFLPCSALSISSSMRLRIC